MALRSGMLLCTLLCTMLLSCTSVQSQEAFNGITRRPKFENLVFFLEGGSESNEGVVAVTYRNRKYYVCDDGWDDVDATVLCRALGLGQEGIATHDSQFGHYTNKPTRYIMSDVDCSGIETDLNQCRYRRNGFECGRGKQAGVICRDEDINHTTNETSDKGRCGYRPFDHKDLLTERERRSVDYIDKIVGGKNAQHGEYPWQVNVVDIAGKNPEHYCGAVIISEYWLLSAAHCFTSKTQVFQMVVGDHNQRLEDEGEQTFDVAKIIQHESFIETESGLYYDIALIKIKPVNGRGIVFNDFVQPACLPDKSSYYSTGLSCLISGWGSLKQGERPTVSPDILQGARVPIVDRQECFETMNLKYENYVSDPAMCAGYMEGGIDACAGDSGGPLACVYNGAYTVVGLTSWGFGCAQPRAPGVYADVNYFLTWIITNINKYSFNDEEKFIPYPK